jgi:hypothetical protein
MGDETMPRLTRCRVVAGAAAPAMPAVAQQVRVVQQADLAILDPMVTSGVVMRNHGFLVSDLAYGCDSQHRPQLPEPGGCFCNSNDTADANQVNPAVRSLIAGVVTPQQPAGRPAPASRPGAKPGFRSGTMRSVRALGKRSSAAPSKTLPASCRVCSASQLPTATRFQAC